MTTFLLLQSAAAWAAPAATQDHAQIKNIVVGFVQQQTATLPGKVTFQVDEIDRRLVLPECAKLEAFLPTGSQLIGKTSIGVRCAPSAHKQETNQKTNQKTNDRPARMNGWSIFVPVQIRLNLNLLTSAHQLPPGHTLQERDLTSQSTETSQPGGFTGPEQVLGKVLRYGIAAGQVLREDMLRQPYSITQGQIVQLAVQGNGFSIRSEGVALNNASEGQTVQIRVAPGRVISGVARAGGVVEIVP